MKPPSRPLDAFLPDPDVAERFETVIHAPAHVVMDVAANFDMQSLKLVKAIFWLREKIMRTSTSGSRKPQGILDETRSLGWGLLAEEPRRLVVCGASCQPWKAQVTFSALTADTFATYAVPDQVKIVWTLEADDVGAATTRFAQETRVAATDAEARRKFLRYWRWARFGIIGIRLLLMPAVRREAERRWTKGRSDSS